MTKGWTGESSRHAMARMGIKTGTKKNLKYKSMIHALPVSNSNPFKKNMIDGTHFKVNKNYTIVAKYEKTRNAFRHIAVLYKDGVEVERTKIPYQNRTWESYTFQSVLQKLLDRTEVMTPKEKEKGMELAKNNWVEEDKKRVSEDFGRISSIAQMGEIFGSTKKEKNDWKARMLKAGLGNKGLQMPEDWDSLSEATKEARLNKVIKFMKKDGDDL